MKVAVGINWFDHDMIVWHGISQKGKDSYWGQFGHFQNKYSENEY